MNFHKEDTLLRAAPRSRHRTLSDEKPPSFSVESPVTGLLRKPPRDLTPRIHVPGFERCMNGTVQCASGTSPWQGQPLNNRVFHYFFLFFFNLQEL